MIPKKRGSGSTALTIGVCFILIALLGYVLNSETLDFVSSSDLDSRPLTVARRRTQSAQLNVKESQLNDEEPSSSRLVRLTNKLNYSDLGKDDDELLGLNLSYLSLEERRRWVKLNWFEFKIMRPDKRSEEFSTRIKAFFKGSQDSCRLRFFKTWIAPASQFQSRELISLLSIFKQHPAACVVILSKSLDNEQGQEILLPLVDAGYKVIALSPDLPFLFARTPAASWLRNLKKGLIDPGKVPLAQNLSNILRLLALYKYGGIYLDNDMLVLRSMARLRNVVAAQSHNKTSGRWHTVNNAVLCFDRRHPIVHSFLKEFASTFNGNKWGYNGPYLVTRVLSRQRKQEHELDWTVLPKETFYPLDWKHVDTLFSVPENDEYVMIQLDHLLQNSYAIHLWNRESRMLTVQDDSLVDLLFRWVLDGTNFVLDYSTSNSS